MAGCDYLPSIKGIGLIKAIKQFDKYIKLDSVIDSLQYNRNFMQKVPKNYYDTVKQV